MVKKKTNGQLKQDDILQDDRDFVIKSAQVKDEVCIYSYEMLQGLNEGDMITGRKGANYVHEDMLKAFKKLNVHLAVLDDAFQYGDIEIEDIDQFHDHDITDLFYVTGIKIKGGVDDEKVTIIGSKSVSVGGRMELESPAVHLSISSYKWYNELSAAVDNVRREVELYMIDGKCTPKDDDADTEDPNQVKIEFPAASSNGKEKKAKKNKSKDKEDSEESTQEDF